MYLNCKTNFSLRYGTFGTEELVQTARKHGITALALTNINSVADAWPFYKYCREQQIKPVLGVEIRNEGKFMYVLLARCLDGFETINSFLSTFLQQSRSFPKRPTELEFGKSRGTVEVIYPIDGYFPAELLQHEWIGVAAHQLTKLFRFPMEKYGDRLVVLQPVSFQDKTFFNAHRLLRAIDKNVLLSQLSEKDQGTINEIILPPDQLQAAYNSYRFIIDNTTKLLASCDLQLDLLSDKNKSCFTNSFEEDRLLLEELAMAGCVKRYGANHNLAITRVKRELEMIHQLRFNAYFLITYDLLRYARSKGYFYVGRGSGANSIVAYCLEITDVDPIELDLYFERFLNPHRATPPDFDIDFSWLDRDDVTEYLFNRYGKERVALLGMVTTFQYNALIRELGKVFGLPKSEIDQLSNPTRHGRTRGFEQKQAEDRIQYLIFRYGNLLRDFPNHLSVHPGGVLISDAPLYRYTTLFLPPKGLATAQLDMFAAEDIGLTKLDILSQRGLGHIKEAVRLVELHHGKKIDIHNINSFKTDPGVRNSLATVNTVGCFYIESPAMRQLLRKLKCSDYLTLVAASSIIRPGVASSGMMAAYLQRYHNPESVVYIHPVMKELLSETFGVMVYQEDVIKVAHHFAGLDLAEADVLRRAMSGKYRGTKEMDRIRDQFFSNSRQRGHELPVVAEIWRQIESFAGYSFSKAHSASYAVESYQSLYLKTYYPKEFMVAVINNFGGFYHTELYFRELSKTGVKILPPCINYSNWHTSIQGDDVYTGFIHIKGIDKIVIERILMERTRSGFFRSLTDLVERTGITKESARCLIRMNALRFTGVSKKSLLWQLNGWPSKQKSGIPSSQPLFSEPLPQFKLPELQAYPLEHMYDEIEMLEFALDNPFQLVNADFHQATPAAKMSMFVNRQIEMIGYLITDKPLKTRKGELMSFGCFLDRSLDWLDTVHFPPSLKQYPLQGKGFYRLSGKVVEDYGVYALEVNSLEKLGLKSFDALTV